MPTQTPVNRAPDWTVWDHGDLEVALWEAVALSLAIDPRHVRERDWYVEGQEFRYAEGPEFDARLVIATRMAGRGLKVSVFHAAQYSKTDLAVFARWAAGRGWEMPDELRAMVEQEEEAVGASSTVVDPPHQPTQGPWPWGAHETELLRHLAAAAERHWARYDPSDPTTAPRSAEVQKWLEDRGLSGRTAKVMAQILRADGLRSGPR